MERRLENLGEHLLVAAVLSCGGGQSLCGAEAIPTLRWERIGPPAATACVMTVELAADGKTIFIGTRPNGLYRSRDGGATWDQPAPQIPAAAAYGANTASLRIHPADPEIVFFGVEKNGCWRSHDGGTTWQQTSAGIAADQTAGGSMNGICFGFDPLAPATVYYGSDGGLFRSVDGGDTWKRLQQGLPPPETSPHRRIESNTVRNIVHHPAKPGTIYLALMYCGHSYLPGMFKSTDNGDTWQAMREGLPSGKNIIGAELCGIQQLAMHPVDPETLYAATVGGGLYRTRDGGARWEHVGDDNAPKGISAFALLPGEPDWFFAGAASYFKDDGTSGIGGGVCLSRDDGANWMPVSDGLVVGKTGAAVTAIVHKGDGSKVTLEGFQNIGTSNVNELKILIGSPSVIYAATNHGLFRAEIPAGQR